MARETAGNDRSEDVGEWLEGLGFGHLRQLFHEQEINFENLTEIADTDLESWSMPFGSRKRLFRAIRTLAGKSALYQNTNAERRQITAIFCDMVGSTAHAALIDPEDMGAVIGAYHQACRSAIEQYGGHVVHYLGDGVFGCFGWPAAHEDDPERAVHAGLAIVQTIKTMAPMHGRAIQVRIGIATGLVVIGDLIGEGASQESSIVGETANLAARLQQAATPSTVVLSIGTRRLIGSFFNLRKRQPINLRGISGQVDWWEAISEAAVVSRFASTRRTRHSELIGREAELTLLLTRWELARRGEGQIVLLSGEPGIGKSHLVETIRERLRLEPHMRFRHQCSPFHMNTPLYPVISHLEWAGRIAPTDDPQMRLAKLSKLRSNGWITPEMVPVLADLVSASPELASTRLDHAIPRRPMLDRLIAFMQEQARKTPVLLLIEDAHWIDPTTRELLDRLSAGLRQSALLILVTLRTGTESLWSSYANATRLQLNRLDRQSAIRIVETVAGTTQLSAAVLERILEKTDGVPLFIEELTKAALNTGLTTEGSPSLAPNHPHAIDIPTTLHDSLMSRLDRLTGVKSVAQICAVIGRGFTYPLALAVMRVRENTVDWALRALVDAEILLQQGAGADAIYTFKHALLQDAAYASLLRSRRQELHSRIGDVLETKFPESGVLNPEVLAYHFTEAGRGETAIRWWHSAGQLAIRRSADTEATVHLRKAIELVATLPPGQTVTGLKSSCVAT